MAAEFSGIDLFGDPILPPVEGRGRPEHQWTLERSNRVQLAFAKGLSVKDAATAIGVSVPTLRKHYSSEVAARDAAAVRFEIVQLDRLNERAKAGSVAAEKELFKQLEKGAMAAGARKMATPPRAKPSPKPGKKEQLVIDAGTASKSGEWGSLLRH